MLISENWVPVSETPEIAVENVGPKKLKRER